MSPSSPFKPGLVPVLGLTLALLASGQVLARDLSRSGSYTTGAGRSGSYSTQVSGNRSEGLTRSQTLTTDAGKTLTRSGTTTYDRQSGAFSRSVTGVNGNTRQLTGTAGGGERSGTYTTGSGRSGSYAGTRTRNDDGTHTHGGTITTQNGEEYSRSVTGGYDTATNTLSREVTGVNGNTRSGSVTITPDVQ